METYTLEQHNIAVGKLSAQVTAFHASKTPFRINHGSTNSTRVREHGTPTLNIGHLSNVLSIDRASRLAVVEPNVPLDALIPAAMKEGLLPPVVMEFPGITVGGGFSGASAESSSWREGSFDCCITSVEIILGDGAVVLAEKSGQNADLFNMARCSLGTLGVVTLLTVRLIESKEFVEVEYHRTTSVRSTIGKLTELYIAEHEKAMGKGWIDYIDGIQYSKDAGVVITGRLVSASSHAYYPIQRFDRGKDPWFYQHARSTTRNHELIPTMSYLFRYDRGAFWTGESFFNYFAIPNTRLFRFLFNPALTTRAIYKNMHAGGGPETNIVQDLVMPVSTSEQFVDYVAEELKIWPLWLCPICCKVSEEKVWGWPVWKQSTAASGTFLHNHGKLNYEDELLINFGVWGAGPADRDDFRRINRRMEDNLRKLRGMKVLYAYSFYTEDEFWELYDKKAYERMRRKWHAEALPSVYEKIQRKEIKAFGDEKAFPLHQRALMFVLGIWPLGGILVGLWAWLGL